MPFLHRPIDQVVLEPISFTAAIDDGIGTIVDLIMADPAILTAPLQRDGAGIGQADVVDMVVGNNTSSSPTPNTERAGPMNVFSSYDSVGFRQPDRHFVFTPMRPGVIRNSRDFNIF